MEVAIDIRLSKELDFFTGAELSVVEGLLPYVELRDALAADVTTSDDATTTAQLPPGPFLSFRTLAPDHSPVVNTGSEVINEYAVLSSANAKSLGFDVGQLESDGEIWFSQALLDFHDFDVGDRYAREFGTSVESINIRVVERNIKWRVALDGSSKHAADFYMRIDPNAWCWFVDLRLWI